MEKHRYRLELFNEFARIGKSMSSPKRLEILDVLTQGPKSVEYLAKITSMSVANVSQHLQILYQSKLVQYEKRGNFVVYQLSDPAVLEFLDSLYGLSEKKLIEIQHIKQQFTGQFKGIEAVTMEELAGRIERREVTLLDVRPSDEFDSGHIQGAISIPIEELAEQLNLLPVNTMIVAYCRGEYCLSAIQATELLKANGFQASYLNKSVHEWNQFSKVKTV